MRWLWLVFLVLLGAQASAATMVTSMPLTGYGSVHIGGTPVSRTLTIDNTGSGNLGFTVSLNNAEYVAVPASGSVPAGGSQAVTITFTPTARGVRDATVTVTTPDDLGNPSDSYNLSGTGTSGNLTVAWTGSPGALDFGTIAVAAATSTRTITVSNPPPGNESLTFSLAITTGDTDYSVPTTTNVNLGVGGSMSITVTFNPSTGGTRTGVATITANDGLNPSDTVDLTGIGHELFASPTSLNFGTVLVGTFNDDPLTITNNGSASRMITAISSGSSVYTFTVIGNPLPRTLAPTESLQLTVRFTPVNGSIVSSNLNITTTGAPATLQVPLTGDGLYKAVTIVATGEPDLMIDLGNSRVNALQTKVVTVTNTGETAQNLELPTSSASQCMIMPTSPAALPTVLDPAEAATFEIRVTPTAVGSGSCTITVTTDIPTTDTITVDWQGVAPEVLLTTPTTAAINFGVVDVDAQNTIRTVVLSNTGGAPLAIGPCTITGSARFSVVTSCTNLSVAPNASATLMVAFNPTVEATEAGTLTLTVDALSTSQIVVTLAGVGADQRLDLSALSVAFPDTNINSANAPIEYIDIRNPANPATGVAETLNISAATIDNLVFELANEGPFTVEANAMIRLAITFRPSVAGNYDGTLTIVSNASSQPMAAIALQGRGIAAPADEAGGCCETGGRPNGALSLLVLALLLRRRRRAA